MMMMMMMMLQTDHSSSYLRAARAGNIEKLLDLLDSGKANISTTNAVRLFNSVYISQTLREFYQTRLHSAAVKSVALAIAVFVAGFLVHSQVTIIFVVSVGLSVCLCRVFLSRL